MTMFHVEIAPGCHNKSVAPIISRHRTWESAVRKARSSDRFVAVNANTGERFQIAQKNSPVAGSGRYGNA